MTLLKRYWILGVLVFTGINVQNAWAQVQSLRVGYTDANLIIAQLPEYRTVMEQLQRLAEGGQAEYEQLIQDFQTELNDYQKKQALLSPEARQTRETSLAEQQGEIQSFLQDKEQELGQKELELLSPLLDKVQNAINEVAQEKDIDLVLSAQSAGSPVILYADQEMDITPDVMDRLGIEPPSAQDEAQ
jgi:outer membrane protein